MIGVIFGIVFAALLALVIWTYVTFLQEGEDSGVIYHGYIENNDTDEEEKKDEKK